MNSLFKKIIYIITGILLAQLATVGACETPGILVQEHHDTLVSEAIKLEDDLRKMPVFEYPIRNPSDVVQLFEGDTVPIFSYGSLLNRASAARTLSEKAMATHKPAIVFSAHRIFDRHVPTTKRWGPMERPNDTAMLNLYITGDYCNIVNGVVIHVGIDDLQGLLDREEGYDLIPVIGTNWTSVVDDKEVQPEMFIAYAFKASDEPREGVYYTSAYINPVPGYAIASQNGAIQYGEVFEKLWIASTYLADKTTSYQEWLENPAIDCECNHGCQ